MDKSIVVAGNFFSTSLSVCDKNDVLTSQGNNDAFILNLDEIVTSAEVPEIQEINVTNNLEEYSIVAEIGENSEGNRDGGTITGTSIQNNLKLVEKVKYGHDGLIPIVITPKTNYSVYSIEVNGKTIDFKAGENGVVTIPVFTDVKSDYNVKVVFEKDIPTVIVHHYIKDRAGNYTTNKLVDDEYFNGKVGEKYETVPKIDIEGYQLEKDSNGNYVVPANANGQYTKTNIVVTYYYEEVPLTLTVHHYLEGTDSQLAKDEISKLYKDIGLYNFTK